MLRFMILFAFAFSSLPEISLANDVAEDRGTFRVVLATISAAYSQGPNFNGFYSSDVFSPIVIESGQSRFTWVSPEDIIEHFNSLIENASEWGSAEERELLNRKKSQAINELKDFLGDQKFKMYSSTMEHGMEYRLDTYYIGTGSQLWFEETWVD